MLLYDVTNEQSFVAVREWIEAVDVRLFSTTENIKYSYEVKLKRLKELIFVFDYDLGCGRKTCTYYVVWE